MKTNRSTTFRLSSSVCTAALLLGGFAAHAQTYTATGNTSIAHVQDFTGFQSDVVTLSADTNAELSIDFDDIYDSVARVGGPELGNRNVVTASGFGNDALLGIESELNLDAGIGAGIALASLGYDLGSSSLQGSLQGTRAEADMSIVLTQNADLVDASVTHNGDMEIYSDNGVYDSTVSVYGNTVEAISGLNRADNGIDITVNNTSSSAAIALEQTSTDSTSYASLDGDIKVDIDDDELERSIAEVDSNLARAVAVGNTATNDMTVDGNSIVANDSVSSYPTAAYDDGENTGGYSAQAIATYAVASSQNLDGNTSLSGVGFGFTEESLLGGDYWDADIQALIADGYDITFEVNVDDETLDSTISVSNNVAAATARGNSIANSVAMAANEILGSDTGTGSVSAIANSQVVSDMFIAGHIGQTYRSVEVDTDDIYSSSVNVDSNSLQMLATGNNGHNIISADANLIDGMSNNGPATSGALEGFGGPALLSYADAAFAINSNQTLVESLVSAALNGVSSYDSGEYLSTAMMIEVDDGYIRDSSVSMSDNTMSATAFGNQINGGVGNQIALSGNDINTTSAITNLQSVWYGGVTASAILADTTTEQQLVDPGTPDTWDVPAVAAIPVPFSYTVSDGFRYIVDVSFDFTPAEQAAIEALGYVYDQGEDWLTRDADLGDVDGNGLATIDSVAGYISNTFVPGSTLIPGDAPTYDYIPLSTPKGVIVEFDGEITDSTVVVDGNRVTSAATMNAAANLTSIDATYIGGEQASAELDSVDLSEGQVADHVVTNAQSVIFGVVQSEADAFFGVTDPSLSSDWTSVFDSSVSVSGNGMSAASTVNASNNGAALTGNAVETTAIVSNNQLGFGEDMGGLYSAAVSGMTLAAPMAIEDTTVAINGNTNTAAAVLNTGVSTLSVDANSIGIDGDDVVGSLTFDDEFAFFGQGSPWVDVNANADYLVGNNQVGLGAVYANAETVIDSYESLRNDQLDVAIDLYNDTYMDGSIDSTITVANNVTTADAKMNSANNSLSLTAGSDLWTSAGVVNGQVAQGIVDSEAYANINALIATDFFADGSLDNSTFMFSGNAARATSAANSATNSLSMASNSTYGTTTGAVDVWGGSDQVAVNYGILNAQGSDAVVYAEVVASFGGGFAEYDNANSVFGSSVSSVGNSIMASAVGNTASNFITLAANDLGTSSAAIHSNQFNTGDIFADVTDSYNGLWGNQDLTNSSALMTGNSVSATAVGNRVVSTISRSGNLASGFNDFR